MQSALREKKIAVLGFGLEGKAIINYFFRHGIKPVLFDQSEKSNFSKADRDYLSRHCSKSYFGKKAFTKLSGYNIAFKSPGIPPASLKNLPKKIQLTSQTEQFIKMHGPQTIGVTGTKGKGTTSTLIYQMLKADGRSGYLTGNIGEVQAFDILDKLKTQDFVVFELSSFQLRNLAVSPHTAVVLMTTSEHLNWHSTLKDYRESKANITKHQKPVDLAVVNSDYPGSKYIGKQGKGKKFFVSRRRPLKNGCFVKDGLVLRASKGRFTKIVKTSEIALKGEHNWENVCAAAETALLLGCRLSAVRKILKTFRGLPHRLEYVASKNGVSFYNDSFSTIPETTIAAFQAFEEPVVLILGGAGKKSDFTQMAKTISKSPHLRAVVVIGKEKARILGALSKAKMQKSKIYPISGGFSQAFLQATRLAKKGDTLLLSPACASFDMFKNYKQRGEAFKELVKKLHG